MLANLTGNAVKFTPQGSVRLEATEIQRDEAGLAWLEFSVSDTGMGIAADKFHLLFQPFSQTDSSMTRQYGGTGLGLSIVSNLAKIMGGDVGVSSEPGQGSRFWFRVPCDIVTDPPKDHPVKEPAAASAETVVLPPAPHAIHVLVVEDNAVNRMVVEALLGKLAYTVSVAHDGAQALEAITRGAAPDLVLMDLHMPVMDGYTATQRIRQWEAENQRAHLPIIALTADAFEQDRQRCLAVGMDDFLTKPISLAALKSALEKWHSTPSQPVTIAQEMTPKVLNLAQFKALSDELLPLLAQNKFNALSKIKELQELVAATEYENELASINQQLQSFAFEQAHTQLKRLCSAISDKHPT
jgi:CheY-like chemotaxis protein